MAVRQDIGKSVFLCIHFPVALGNHGKDSPEVIYGFQLRAEIMASVTHAQGLELVPVADGCRALHCSSLTDFIGRRSQAVQDGCLHWQVQLRGDRGYVLVWIGCRPCRVRGHNRTLTIPCRSCGIGCRFVHEIMIRIGLSILDSLLQLQKLLRERIKTDCEQN